MPLHDSDRSRGRASRTRLAGTFVGKPGPFNRSLSGCSAVPFFLTGCCFSAVFAREVSHHHAPCMEPISCGGALACLSIVPLLNGIGGPNTILFWALRWRQQRDLGSCTPDAQASSRSWQALCSCWIAWQLLRPPHRRRLRQGHAPRSKSWVEFARWNAISRVEVG